MASLNAKVDKILVTVDKLYKFANKEICTQEEENESAEFGSTAELNSIEEKLEEFDFKKRLVSLKCLFMLSC